MSKLPFKQAEEEHQVELVCSERQSDWANNLRQFIRFSTVVRHVNFNDEKEEFNIDIEDFSNNSTECLTFDCVIVATDHLICGDSFSAEDIDLRCYQFGAKSIKISCALRQILSFPIFDGQVALVCDVFLSRIQLPDKDQYRIDVK
ncbi:hypothetical protein I4U23_023558 [Adineta vaga]|nr:hypothetical protein I4U23_023558 [Adineta vaga]